MKRLIQHGNWVVVELKPKDERTAGGLYLPDQLKETEGEGVVVSCPPECDIVPGDYVLFPASNAFTLSMDGKRFAMVRLEDVCCYIREVKDGPASN